MAQRQSTSSAYPPRQHIPLRYSNPDVFSDDYAVEPQQALDGHRTQSLDVDGSHDDVAHTKMAETPRRSLSFQRIIEPPLASSRRSRGSQRTDGQSSISSRLNRRSSSRSHPARSMTSMSDISNSASTAQRSSRTLSTLGFPRSQSPYQGATGPSHPYGMYPQDIGLTRTPSTATTSTIRRPERSYSGPSGPTQPYGMYSQNTVPEDDLDIVPVLLAPPIVAGFPGRGQDFERRLGPDGEDVDDLIGPDGYTEQLPPYSRYANGVPPKYSSGIGSLRRSAPEPPVHLVDSRETLHSSQTRDQVGLVNPFSDSSTRLDSVPNIAEPGAPPMDEAGNFKERIRERSRRKVCCGLLPWWLLGVIIFVVFLAVFLGGVIGGVVAHERGEEKGRKEAVQTFTAAATAPIATAVTAPYAPDVVTLSSTPSNLPPLPTGQFSVVLDGPSMLSNSCLTNPAQESAWDCATGATLLIDITMTSPNVPVASLSYPAPPGAPIRYGAQPPVLDGPVTMSLRADRAAFNKGPAYVFLQSYNKTVIVRKEDLPDGSPGSKRSFLRRWFSDDEDFEDSASLFERDNSQFPYNQYAKAGEQIWYCFWNSTTLEGFVFLNQNAETHPESEAYTSAAAISAAATYQTPSMPYQTSSIPYQGRAKRQTQHNPPAYPKIIKIQERRSINNPISPYCQQMQILYNQQLGYTVPGMDSPLTIQLDETESAFQQKLRQGGGAGGAGPAGPAAMSAAPTSYTRKRNSQDTRAPNGNNPSCHCQWMAGA